MEELGGLHSMGSLRVGCDWATSLSLSHNGEGNGNPLQCSCLENPRNSRAWWAAIYGVTQSQKRLKRLTSSSSSNPLGVFIYVYMNPICVLICNTEKTLIELTKNHAQSEVLISHLWLFHTWSPWLCHHKLFSLPMFSQRWVNDGYLANKVW